MTKYFERAEFKILIRSNDEEMRTMMVRLRDNISKEFFKLRESGIVKYNDCDYDYVIEHNYDDDDVREKFKAIANLLKQKRQ